MKIENKINKKSVDNRVYTMNSYPAEKEEIKKRKQKFIQEGLSYYKDAKKITQTVYKKLKTELEAGDKDALRRLFLESTMDIINSTADVYASFDVEEYMSFEECLSFVFEYMYSYYLNYEYLPANRTLFKSNIIQLTVYKTVIKAYNLAKSRSSEFSDVIWNIDKIESEEISFKNLNIEDLKPKLEKIFSQLNNKEQKLIRMAFGLDDGKPKSYAEVGKALGVSRARVGFIVQKALKKLRHPDVTNKIKDYSITDLNI